MKKGQLLKFLEPFTDEVDIIIAINDGVDPEEVDFKPLYTVRDDGEGVVFLIVEDEM